mmetsp:Transcript_143871/g.400956  ORF Transcript_143871/g.400956 Transcript_143871/m.400956 type:complete len:276 (-) Transcript_143871:978-1805(-)
MLQEPLQLALPRLAPVLAQHLLQAPTCRTECFQLAQGVPAQREMPGSWSVQLPNVQGAASQQRGGETIAQVAKPKRLCQDHLSRVGFTAPDGAATVELAEGDREAPDIALVRYGQPQSHLWRPLAQVPCAALRQAPVTTRFFALVQTCASEVHDANHCARMLVTRIRRLRLHPHEVVRLHIVVYHASAVQMGKTKQHAFRHLAQVAEVSKEGGVCLGQGKAILPFKEALHGEANHVVKGIYESGKEHTSSINLCHAMSYNHEVRQSLDSELAVAF